MRSSFYVLAVVGTVVAVLASGFAMISIGRDHPGQITLDGDADWYMTLQPIHTLEMQDRDILFHGIGASVENLRKADIVILGHSVLQYGIDHRQVEAFEARHGVRIFNLSMPGVASGEFTRRLIKEQQISPKIWIINADDYPAPFFTPSMDDFFTKGRNSIGAVADTGYWAAYKNVVGRNIRMALERTFYEALPRSVAVSIFPKTNLSLGHPPAFYRNVKSGNFFLEKVWVSMMTDAPQINVIRDQNCPASEAEIESARQYLSDIGGTAILTLVPYERWCPMRVRQIAERLGLESFFPTDTNFAVWDQTHMTITGAERYTRFFLNSIEQTSAFKALVCSKKAPEEAATCN